MKHKCTKCKRVYEENAEEIITGCICGNNRFFFVKPRKQKKEEFVELDDEENEEIIILDTETVNIIENGKYEIDISSLLEKKIPVYKYSEGKYSIDLGKISK
ncbi:MAG: OapC/ArvC family zinc-ribbon domain-containing protein [Candidatus Woesearchaeota archaeon]